MIRIDSQRTPKDLLGKVNRLFELSGHKIRSLEDSWRPAHGAPVFTIEGRYTARGWTGGRRVSVRLVAAAVRHDRSPPSSSWVGGVR